MTPEEIEHMVAQAADFMDRMHAAGTRQVTTLAMVVGGDDFDAETFDDAIAPIVEAYRAQRGPALARLRAALEAHAAREDRP